MKRLPWLTILLGVEMLAIGAACSLRPASPGQTPTTLKPTDMGSQLAMSPSITATPLPPTIETAFENPPGDLTPVSPTPTPCLPNFCPEVGHFLLSRPIAPPGRDWVDPTYRYGSTQNGAREAHHGVEFVNSSGTPIIAAADGEVIVAGDDNAATYAAWPYFYGNLVVLRHEFAAIAEPIFTLYGHLSEIVVDVGQLVTQGQELGRVGLTGVATGSHLHFEVRQGENSYDQTRNPELWLAPRADASGQTYGAIAGRIEDGTGQVMYVPNVVLEYLPEPGGDPVWQLYLETYAEPNLRGEDEWGENFAVGDLPAGWYRITFVLRGMQMQEVQVLPGKVTVVRVNVDA